MSGFSNFREKIRKSIVILDDIVHIIVAIILIAVAGILLVLSMKNFSNLTPINLLHVINDVLLVLIVMELLWTIIRYLRRLAFSLSPFLFIGVISGTRRIITLEAEMTLGNRDEITLLLEVGVMTFVVFILVLAYYLYEKARSLNVPDQ